MKPWLKSSFLVLISFLVGFAAAGVTFRFCFHPFHPPGMADKGRILDHLGSKLDLTAEQKNKLDLMLDQFLPKTDALRQDEDKKLQALRETFHSQMRALLTADQEKKYDAMLARWEQRQKDQAHFFGDNSAPVSMEPVTSR